MSCRFEYLIWREESGIEDNESGITVGMTALKLRIPTVDQTALFKAMAKMRASKQGKGESAPKAMSTPPSTSFPVISTSLEEVAGELVQVLQLVLSKRGDYLSFNHFHPLMSDAQRDRFDEDTLKMLNQLKNVVENSRKRIAAEQLHDEERQHLQAVADGLERRVKYIVEICAKMRSTRLAHLSRRKRDFRLSALVDEAMRNERKRMEEGRGLSPISSISSLLSLERQSAQEVRRRRAQREEWDGWSESRSAHTHTNETVAEEMERRAREEEEEKKRKERRLMEDGGAEEETLLGDTSPLAVQLQAENAQLVVKFEGEEKQIVDHVESQVAEIMRMQETFSEKISEQERIVDDILDLAVEATENIKDGNDWIREAIANSASRRVVVLFCIVVLTFAILFVDWYNP